MIKDVSVIIVNWNSGNYLQQTIESLIKETKDIPYEVIVLDNQSKTSDTSYKYMEDVLKSMDNVKVVFNEDNLGFAKANNKGIEMAEGRHILLLNPDVILQNNMVKILADFMDSHKEVGMSGPKVLNPDNTFQTTCLRGEPYPSAVLAHLSGLAKMFKNNAYLNRFALNHLDKDEIHYIAGISGCCMMISRDLIEDVGMFDEQFFMYQEETDWCWRSYQAGWKIAYNPEAVIIHDRGATTKKALFKSNYTFCNSMMKFFKKHHFQRYNAFQKAFFIVLIWVNFVVRSVKIHLSLLFKKKQALKYSNIE